MKSFTRAFSLVEVLAAVAIIGIIVFLALPNVIQAKLDAEEQMVITRAEALNMSISSFITANGRTNAGKSWTDVPIPAGGDKDDARYSLISGYMAYAPTTLANYEPSGYSFAFDASLDKKVVINRTTGGALPY